MPLGTLYLWTISPSIAGNISNNLCEIFRIFDHVNMPKHL